MWFALLIACGPDIRSLYDEERIKALQVASERPSEWEPDLVVSLGNTTLARAVDAAAEAALQSQAKTLRLELPLGAAATLEPNFEVDKVELGPSDVCGSCLSIDAKVSGKVGWGLGAMGGRFTGEGSVRGVLELAVVDGTQVVGKIRKIGKVSITSKDIDDLRINPSRMLEDWVRTALAESLPPIKLVDLAASKLPLRDLRVKTTGSALRVEVLSDVPGAGPAVVPDAEPASLALGISESALGGLVRRAAFERGVLDMDVAIDPRSISVAGDAFMLNLRVWRLVGSGWYRDYDVSGTLSITDKKLRLKPSTVKELGASPGAELVDPLAALGSSLILEAIAENLNQSLPAAHRESVAGVGIKAVATEVRGENGTLLVLGELRVVRGAD